MNEYAQQYVNEYKALESLLNSVVEIMFGKITVTFQKFTILKINKIKK